MKPILVLSPSLKYTTAIEKILDTKFSDNYQIIDQPQFEEFFQEENFSETVYLIIMDIATNQKYECFSIIQKMKSSQKSFSIPIFILSSVHNARKKNKAISMDVSEYKTFPVTPQEITLKCESLIDHYLDAKNYKDGVLLYSELNKETKKNAHDTKKELNDLLAAHEAVFELSRQELLIANNKLKENFEAKLSALKEKSDMQMLFGKYISPDVIDFIMHKEGARRLSGEKRDITVLFSDIRGFTHISETVDPIKVVILLNEFFTELTETVIKHHGMIDKYSGDNIMAVFGAPLDLPNHKEWAILAAIEMQKKFTIIQEKWLSLYKIEAGMGIGINTGPAIVGSIGSYHKLSYTAIGDTVNMAARFEQIALDKQIIFGEKIKKSLSKPFLKKNKLTLENMGAVALKGKSGSHNIYNLYTTK